MSKNKDLILVDTALQEFDAISAGFALLEKNFKGVVFDVTDEIGMAHAKAARDKIRTPRRKVEKIRKKAKAPLLKLGRDLDEQAKALTAKLLEIEEPIANQIEWQEQAEERERLRKAAAEQERVAKIQERIAYLRGNPTLTKESGSQLISQHIADLEGEVVDESFAEFLAAAQDAKVAGLSRLNALLASAKAHEAEMERIRVERAELAKLRAEAAAREEAIRAERAKRDAEIAAELAEARRVAQEQRDAELAAQAEANRLERERIAAEEAEAKRLWDIERAKRRAEEEAELARERAENERIAAQRREELELAEKQAEAQRQAESARLAKEWADFEAARDAAQKHIMPFVGRELNPRSVELAAQFDIELSKSQFKRIQAHHPSKEDVIAAVAGAFGLSNAEAVAVLALYDWRDEVGQFVKAVAGI